MSGSPYTPSISTHSHNKPFPQSLAGPVALTPQRLEDVAATTDGLFSRGPAPLLRDRPQLSACPTRPLNQSGGEDKGGGTRGLNFGGVTISEPTGLIA